MTINEALQILLDNSDYAQYNNSDDVGYAEAFKEITDRLGVFYDKNTDQFITTDTGDVI
jgi:hypothetical protein